MRVLCLTVALLLFTGGSQPKSANPSGWTTRLCFYGREATIASAISRRYQVRSRKNRENACSVASET